MNVYVFIGPSLSRDDARQELNATYLPPVSQGDVCRVAAERPLAIGIIDGYFERIPAVWHKEILWAMTQGVRVYGSASMGALRAAELETFGMVGVGEIFEAYRDGVLEDDDEVAVAHAAAETGYMPVSEAMINIRCTLKAAVDSGVLSATTRTELERIAKELFYPDRCYGRILEEGATRACSPAELQCLREWLPKGQVNRKRDDALAMLRRMRDDLASGLSPKRANFAMEHTASWDRLALLAGSATQDHHGETAMVQTSAVLEELRLDRSEYVRTVRAAMLRHLALMEARRLRLPVPADAAKRIPDEWLRSRGLCDAAQLASWIEENDLTQERLDQLLEEESLVETVFSLLEKEAVGRLADQLRLTGNYSTLLARARQKQRLLEDRGLQDPTLDACETTVEALLAWYFGRAGEPVPDSTQTYARSVGFGDEDAFLRALLREFCHVHEQSRGELEIPHAETGKLPVIQF